MRALLKQPETPLAFFSTLMGHVQPSVHQDPPRFFSVKVLPMCLASTLYWCMGLLPCRYRASHFLSSCWLILIAFQGPFRLQNSPLPISHSSHFVSSANLLRLITGPSPDFVPLNTVPWPQLFSQISSSYGTIKG